ncbi:uncharacterized protein (DUF1800 family) [Paucibacter oligotrophus]|uniref:Uncharacterized protein (DUF1800 family) n=1 Tax=Roseateles oligotrophus TaxID=1769250 RepID=A0A840LIY0_9BURK|nr:DUF1800 domain-containing protein [Roseateles oligotrophus]MBB4846168.1 uncharacterized protein (DUF1800 family) [Roseateles oligotrophus]
MHLSPRTAAFFSALALAGGLSGCAGPGPAQPAAGMSDALLNRLSWGAGGTTLAQAARQDLPAYLQAQLHPQGPALPAEAQAQIDAMSISKIPLQELVLEMEQRRKAADALADDEQKKAARQAYQQEMNRLAREAASRHLLRALYSRHQVQEQMSWFWLNHFSVFQGKGNLRAMVGDYEEQALRPHALGKFRTLLGAVVSHPAMLRYLDNEQNAAGRLNENFARELMELHTLGVDGGYGQRDVQELARVLTGVGINAGPGTPGMKRDLQGFYVRKGMFEFNPARHDFGAKTLLGRPIQAQGLAELNEALDRLASHPATALFISRKLAQFWLSDEPPPALVRRMAQAFEANGGDIAATLALLFNSAEFAQAGPGKFKDPMRYAVSAVRLAYAQKPVLNMGPMLNWLNRMGEPLYGRLTPDGYPLNGTAWSSPGQMSTRFEIAKAIGSGSAGLFRSEGAPPQEKASVPQLAQTPFYISMAKTLSPATQQALAQANSAQEWNAFLLSSPEFMSR